MSLAKRAAAEFIGTLWLVFGGCGSAVLAAHFLAADNPNVNLGLWTGRRFPASDILPYAAAQVLGGVAGAGVLRAIAGGQAGFDVSGGFASNGYGDHSPGHYALPACFTAEVMLTFFFLVIILGATDKRAPKGFAPVAIGLGLTLVHLIGIPVTDLSVNPARGTGPALFVGGWALAQLWLFWVAPLLGAALAGLAYRWLETEEAVDLRPPISGDVAR